MLTALLRRVPWWAYVFAALLAVIGAQYLTVSSANSRAAKAVEDKSRIEAQLNAYHKHVEAMAKSEQIARQQRENAYRDREKQITADATRRVKSAQAAAAGLRADVERLRHAAAASSGAVEAVATAGERAAGAGRAAVLADMLGRCAGRHAELAIVADRARIAGAECEARYDSAAVMTGR